MSEAKVSEMLFNMTRAELREELRALLREERGAPPAAKRYVDAKDICTHFAVSRSTVQTWIAEGCPHLARGKVLRFELAAVEEWFRGRERGLRSVK